MVDFKNSIVISKDFVAVVKLWHAVGGLYIWEFLTVLDYEWSVIRGSHSYRWTIWLHSFTRLATLGAVIISMVGFDTPGQLTVSFGLPLGLPLLMLPLPLLHC